MSSIEINLDGLVGPTHNYAGLAHGNVASSSHKNQISNPRAAALQGLQKMILVRDLGIHQAVLPPQLRPDIDFLNSCGFHGTIPDILKRCSDENPVLLAAASSAAAMWTANAATVSPSIDCSDHKTHLTPANLMSGLHRSIEAKQTAAVLRHLFPGPKFTHHPPLRPAHALADEGAANHMRIAPSHQHSGIEVFVFGFDPLNTDLKRPSRFPARQSRLASEAVARNHNLDPSRIIMVQQNPDSIDDGVFHNDVVAVANENVLLCHEDAFVKQESFLEHLGESYRKEFNQDLVRIEIPRTELPLKDTVNCYLFNSQLVSAKNGDMVLVAPTECEDNPTANQVIKNILAGDNPITQAIFPDVRQSMMNGGGPACLRLRAVLNESELEQMHFGIRLTDELVTKLQTWIENNYRTSLSPTELGQPQLFEECQNAMDELESILKVKKGLFNSFGRSCR